jgi:hypothetical protein
VLIKGIHIGMQHDIWINTTTNTTTGVTGAFGSPRGWLRRALDVPNLDDTTFHKSSITPYEISVAGIWYLPVAGLPVTGNHRELIRWFEAPDAEHINRPKSRVPSVPVIGIAAAVPMNEVMHWLKTYREAGATYTWWKKPEDKSVRAVTEKPRRRQLDHARVYSMLNAGKTSKEISNELDFPRENINYVVKKWRQGLPLQERRPFINQEELMDACRKGEPVNDLADKFNVSPAYIYNLLKKAA